MQQIKINNSLYDVYFVEPNHAGLQNGSALGLSSSTNKEIYVNRNLKNKQDILRHEITHAVIYEYLQVDFTWNEEHVCEFVQRYYKIIEDLVRLVVIEDLTPCPH